MDKKITKQRIRWCCRRGMLELDLILGPFFDRYFDTLTPDEQNLFIELLDCDDPDIYAWIMGFTEPEQKFQGLIKIITAYAYHPA
jgi:antitoxin CptB